MPNDIKITICEYGSDIITGLPNGQKIKCKDTIYLNIHILEEYEPMSTQHLKTEDIIEELDKVSKNIRRYINYVILAPFVCPIEYPEVLGPILATGHSDKGKIIIYAIPASRDYLKSTLAEQFCLSHEAGHIIDGKKESKNDSFACSSRWTMAMCEDSKSRKRADLPKYYVSWYAQDMKSLHEDFADSVMYYSDDRHRIFLKENFPNRYKILEELLEKLD